MAHSPRPTSDEAHAANASVLPEPELATRAGRAVEGNPDDLIAQLADREIDAMLAASESARPDPASAVEAAVQAAQELSALADGLSQNTAGAIEQDLRDAIGRAEAAAESAHPAPTPVPTESVPAEPASAEPESTAASTEDTQAEAAEPPPAPSFNPPRHADVERDPADEAAADAAAISPGQAYEPSDAEEVAAEIAADAALVPAHVHSEPSSVPVDVPPVPSWRRVIDGIAALPMLLLGLINLPVRGLSDAGREAIGAIAIVTLANATAILLYLVLFG